MHDLFVKQSEAKLGVVMHDHSGVETGVAGVATAQINVKHKKEYYAVLMKQLFQLFQLSWSSWPPHRLPIMIMHMYSTYTRDCKGSINSYPNQCKLAYTVSLSAMKILRGDTPS